MNNKGMAQIYLILILPLVFTLVFAGLWMVWFMIQRNRIENLCHESLLKSQKTLVNGNTELLSHNLTAYSLIISKRILKKLRRSPNPYVAAAAVAGHQIVVQEQRKLARVQRQIIFRMNYRSQNPIYHFHSVFFQKVEHMASLWKTTMYHPPWLSIFPKKTQVEIRIKDIASVYKRPLGHKIRQTIKAQWRIPLRNFFPRWLESYFKNQNQWVGECASHPKNNGDFKWYPSIGEASPW